jgi:zinc protease
MRHTVQEITLNSGAQGLLVDVPGSTVVDMEFTFLSGHLFVQRSKFEIAHSMEHLIFGANKFYPDAQSFSREFGLNGAYHNAYTNMYLNGYVAEVAEFEWNRVMTLFWQGLTTPKFLKKEFVTEQETVVEELAAKLDKSHITIDVELSRAMGEDHLVDYKTRIEYVKNIEPSDLKAHHIATHNAENMRFIVAGNLRGKRNPIVALLERYTADLPDGQRKQIPDARLIRPIGPITVQRDVDKVFFDIKTAFYGELNERQQVALGILSYALTGAWDSRIFGKGRTKGLLYHIGSNGGSSAGVTGFGFSGSVVASKAQALYAFVADELLTLKRDGLTANELKAAKQYMLGSFQLSHQTTQSLVNWYARYFVHDEYFSFTDRADLIKSVTRRDIDQLIEQLFTSEYWGNGLLGKHIDNEADKLHQTIERVWH